MIHASRATSSNAACATGVQGLNLGDVTRVKEIFRRFSIPGARGMIVKGWFHETFPRVEIPRVALLHIDADWYQSVKLCLEKFFDCVQPGGFIVLDDYGWFEGCRKATDEFLESRNLRVNLVQVDASQHYFAKPMDGSPRNVAGGRLAGVREEGDV